MMDNGLSDKYDTDIGRILGREAYRPRRTIHSFITVDRTARLAYSIITTTTLTYMAPHLAMIYWWYKQ